MKLLQKILLVVTITSSLFSATPQKPASQFKADGAVIDLVYKNHKLYVATKISIVDIFNIKTKKIIKKIKVPNIKDFMGDEITAKIYSVDVIDDNVLVLAQAEHGYRSIYIYKNNKLIPVITIDDKLYIAKAKFIDKDTLVLGLLSNDIISYNIKTKKQNWSVQPSGSKFSNLVLNEDKTEVVICDESGDLHILDTKTGKVIKTLKGQNLDNVFQADYKNNIVATAGQDRRTVIYNLRTGSSYYKTTHFLIYSVGLSPSGKIAGFASDENNNVTVFNTATKSTIGIFGDNKMTLTNIVFLNEKEFFVGSDDKTINFYKIK